MMSYDTKENENKRKEDATLDLEMVFRVIFVVGVVTIPVLYWLSGRATGDSQGRTRNQEERTKQDEERNLSRSS
jgi:hypothetical protein